MSVQPDTDQLVAVRIDPDGTITPIRRQHRRNGRLRRRAGGAAR